MNKKKTLMEGFKLVITILLGVAMVLFICWLGWLVIVGITAKVSYDTGIALKIVLVACFGGLILTTAIYAGLIVTNMIAKLFKLW